VAPAQRCALPVRSLDVSGSTPPIRMKKWICIACGLVYDEAAGMPDHGIPPGTRFEDIPAGWLCPDCGATKDYFEPFE